MNQRFPQIEVDMTPVYQKMEEGKREIQRQQEEVARLEAEKAAADKAAADSAQKAAETQTAPQQ